MRQTRQLWTVHSIRKSNNVHRVWHLSLTLFLGMLAAIAAPMNAEIWEPGAEEELQLGPIENPSSPLPARGYQSRPCGFDLNHNGIVGEPADCNVCDASLVSGKIVANTVDPDGDGIEEDLIYVDCDDGSNFNYCGRPGFRPCGTIEYAWDTIADGPEDGAEDIVCFTGTCSPDTFRSPRSIQRSARDTGPRPRPGSETRDWQFPDRPRHAGRLGYRQRRSAIPHSTPTTSPSWTDRALASFQAERQECQLLLRDGTLRGSRLR